MTEKEGKQRGKRLRRVREEGGSGNGGVTEYEGRSERARIEGGAQNVNETKRVPKTANRKKIARKCKKLSPDRLKGRDRREG